MTIGSGQSTIDIHDTSQHIFIDARGLGNDTINLLGIGGNIDVKSWYDDDSVTVDMLAGSLVIDAGEGNDIVTVDYLGGKSSAIITLNMKSSSSLMILLAQLGNGTVPGGPGNDRLLFDGRDFTREGHTNTMYNSHINWSGGQGNDKVEMYFVSAGTTNLNIANDKHGNNEVVVSCADWSCTVLSRSIFLANMFNAVSEAVMFVL